MAEGMDRRSFLKVLGVAGAGGGLAGCGNGNGPERLIPYLVPVEETVPGLATWYRTTCRECPAGCGMNIRTREGRAVKAEGNPLSPISHGKLCARGQASLQGLYDPDRVPQALARAADGAGADDREGAAGWQRLSWGMAEQRLVDALGEADPARTVLLTSEFTGTMDRLLDEWANAFGIERVRFAAFGWEPIRAANRLLFGIDGVPVHDFANAGTVISFGADFIETWISPVDYQHGFTRGHALAGERRGRFIAVTPHQSLTDMSADEWVAARPGSEQLVALAIAKRLVETGRGEAGPAAAFLDGVDVAAAAESSGVPEERIDELAEAFGAADGSLAVGPGVQSTHGAATAVAAAVGVLNYVAGNIGETVRFARREETAEAVGSYRETRDLLRRMAEGSVDALLVYGANPLYSLPVEQDAAAAIERVPFVAVFDPYLTETASHADVLLPDHHFLESWGDHLPRTGVRSLIQPVMRPVFDTKQTGDVLLSVARRAGRSLPTEATTYYDYLRESWRRDVYPRQAGADAPFDEWWREALQLGAVTTEDSPAEPPVALNADALGTLSYDVPDFAGDDDAEHHLVVYPSYRFYDGRTANRPWLQELPDPVSKIAWSSWVEVSPETAETLGLDIGSVVEVATPYGAAELPVWVHPGTRSDVIAVQLGQGHEEFGRYARDRGVNAVRLLAPVVEEPSGALVWFQTRASLRPTGEWRKLPYTAGEQTQAGREVLRTIPREEAPGIDGIAASAIMATGWPPAGEAGEEQPGGEVEGEPGTPIGDEQDEVPPQREIVHELQEMGGFAPAEVEAGPGDYPPPGTYYGEYSEEQPRWGMAIDLDRCTGCSACMTACYAENNIGIVGPEQVARGRILSWIRIESYWGEDEEHPSETPGFLPMLCQHCGNAPCEPVCPVYAAYHTPDGLNAQVYNRCVGTRYCANNCPYKVRHFNYFTYEWPEPLNWQLNPDVAVREKGVMEKCTFCVQRIREAQHEARLEGRGVPDGRIQPACAQTCPSNVIHFGNIKDPETRVAQIAASGRAYRVFQEELNTQSGIVYLKQVVEHAAETGAHASSAGGGSGPDGEAVAADAGGGAASGAE
ncbi:MAG: molybdopterin-dependent oxidoreductase, partial [Gemmatimonadota bacterium]